MVPVYDMNKSDGDGFMGGGAGWMWVVMLFFLLAWGGGFGGFGGNGANGAVNTLTNILPLMDSVATMAVAASN